MYIKTSPANTMNLEELVVATAVLGLVTERIHDNGNDVPSNIKNELAECEVALATKTRADKRKRLQLLKLQEQSYLGRAEKLALAKAEREALEVELGIRPATSSKAAGRK